MIEIIDMVENTQHFKYHRLWYLFLYFGIFHSKSVIMLVLCLFLAKKYFNQFSLSVLKMNDTVNFEDNFCTFLVVIKPDVSIPSL